MSKQYTFMRIAILALAALFSSCDKGGENPEDPDNPDTPGQPGTERTELLLSTTVEAATKADFPETDTQLAARQDVAVWVHEATSGTPELYGRNVLTANGSGGLSGGKAMYFPENGNRVHIYALCADPLPTESAYPAESLTHTVSADQRKSGGYTDSDLLYARRTDVSATDRAVSLTFRHLLAQVKVSVFFEGKAAGVESITLNGTRRDALYTLDRTKAPGEITVVPTGTVSPIRIGTDLTYLADEPDYNAAIVVPQTLKKGTSFIVIRMADGTELPYVLPEDTTFEGGKKYFFNISVRQDELVISTTVQDWSSGGQVEGEVGKA